MNYDPNKNKSMGYDPIPSTGNNIGYYMGDDSSLMDMMQTGGRVNPIIARALQIKSDEERLEKAAEKEGGRQKRGRLFGSIGGLLGGVAGAALAPLTGGLSIPVAAGLGTALGKGAGEFLGAGKATELDTEGTVFAQDAFGDIEKAGEEFNQGMLGRAGVAGLKAGFTAGLAPGGGIYGKAGKFGEKLQAGSIPVSDTGIANILDTPDSLFPSSSLKLPSSPDDLLLTKGTLTNPLSSDFSLTRPATSPSVIPSGLDAEILGDVAVPDFDTSLLDLAGTEVSEKAYQDSLLDSISLGEDNRLLDAARTSLEAQRSAEGTSARMKKLLEVLQNTGREPIVEVGDFLPLSNNNPFNDADFISSYLARLSRPQTNFENGGEVQNYQYGGFTAEDVFKESGLMPSSDQLGLFESFDPTRIQSATQDISESLLGMTGGQGIVSQGGSGFGAQESMVNRLLSQSQQDLESEIESEQSRFARDVQRQIAEDIRLGVEYDEYDPEALRQLYLTNQARRRGSTGGRHYSDLRLKKDIHLIGKSIQGLNIYNFKYKDKSYGDETYQGVMAQEVPWASFEMDNGYLAVDYNKIDVDFKKVNNG